MFGAVALGAGGAAAVGVAVAAVAVLGGVDAGVAVGVLAAAAALVFQPLRAFGDRGVGEGAEELAAGERDPLVEVRDGYLVAGGELLGGELGGLLARVSGPAAPVLGQLGRVHQPLAGGLAELRVVQLAGVGVQRPEVGAGARTRHRRPPA